MENIKVGTVFKGNTQSTAKITKVVINGDNSYICYKASDQHVKDIEQENKKRVKRKISVLLKPIKPARMGLNVYLGYVKSGTITIISKP